jgi:osmoprotectant transport system ATP-binding protein
MLELKDISKSFGPSPALDRINLVIEPRTTTVLIGPSGSGKSTLLRVLIGLVAPDSGSVIVDGLPLARDNLTAVRRRTGYVIQDGGLFPHLTARENVTLLLRHLGRDEVSIASRVRELTALTRFPEDALDRYPLEISGGQRQRVSLMRALMPDPAVLLLDEPLGALDPMIRSDLQSDLRDIFRTLQKTVVLVTHDMAEAAFLGDLLVLMKDGAIIQAGSFEELVTRPADPFVPAFISAQRKVLSLEGVR